MSGYTAAEGAGKRVWFSCVFNAFDNEYVSDRGIKFLRKNRKKSVGALVA